MTLSSPVSPRDLGLKEKKFQSIEDAEAAYNIIVRRLNETYKYNRRDHDRLTEDVGDVSGGGSLTVEVHTSDDTLTPAESGSVHINSASATASVTLTLPIDPPAGTYYTFATMDTAWQLRIDPGNETSTILTTLPIAGKYIYSYNVNRNITLMADANGDWVVISEFGSWPRET